MQPHGYILTGGKSKRFGDEDKALALLQGLPLVERVARHISPDCKSIHLVRSETQNYDHLNYPSIVDERADLGPLGGIYTALSHAGAHQWAFVCACDLSQMGRSWLPQLLSAIQTESDAVVFRGDRFEPLFTLYHGRIVPVLLEQIDKRVLAPHHLFKIVNTTVLELPKDWPREPSFNTRESLEAFQE